jgi:hypothetical protein
MQSAERMPWWKPTVFILGLLLAIGVLLYPFMGWRVEQRELECGKRCADKGFSGYRYSPPRGARHVSPDECECVNIK